MRNLKLLIFILLFGCMQETKHAFHDERTETYIVTYFNGDKETVTVTYSYHDCRLREGDFKCGNCSRNVCNIRSGVRSIQKVQP